MLTCRGSLEGVPSVGPLVGVPSRVPNRGVPWRVLLEGVTGAENWSVPLERVIWRRPFAGSPLVCTLKGSPEFGAV
jgi:hypothetical protein